MKQTVKLVETENEIRLPFAFCIQCGKQTHVKEYEFVEDENNPVAQFAKLVGDVGVIAEYVLNKPHKVMAPFCFSCFKRFRGVQKRQQIFILLGLIAVFVGIVISSITHQYVGIPWSILPFGISILICIGSRVYSRFYKWQNSPNITKINKKQIVLKIPGRGKFVCYR